MSHRNGGRRASAAVRANRVNLYRRSRTDRYIVDQGDLPYGANIDRRSRHWRRRRQRARAEAGVWVIAETTDLPTKFAKIFVTDDAGRYYLIPDLPKANYKI